MAEIVLFHHAQGLTDGVRALGEELRRGGHTVHVPDLYEGRTFDDLEEGVGHARAIGFDTVAERGKAAAAELPHELVYIGISLGAMPAQDLAQNRPGARAAVILHSAMPPEEFGSPWPSGLPLQIHTMEGDDWGDVEIARQLDGEVPEAEVFLYPGDAHLSSDSSLPVYDEQSTRLILQRVRGLLDRLD
jgi:dienelactone hydrolase